jgi:cytochrome c-type biogenesis protein CcmH
LLASAGITTLAQGFDEPGYENAISVILCDCGCHPQSVKECACGRAAEMRGEIRARMEAEGLDGEQLVAAYVAEHGEQILIAPAATGFNLIAWLGPLVGLFVAAGGMLWVLRSWKAKQVESENDGSDTPTEAPAGPEDDAYLARVKRELEEM